MLYKNNTMLMIFFNLAIRDNKPFTWSGNPCLLKAPPRPISAQEAGVTRGPETGLQVFGSPSRVHGNSDSDSTFTMAYIHNGLHIEWCTYTMAYIYKGLHTQWPTYRKAYIHNGLHTRVDDEWFCGVREDLNAVCGNDGHFVIINADHDGTVEAGRTD